MMLSISLILRVMDIDTHLNGPRVIPRLICCPKQMSRKWMVMSMHMEYSYSTISDMVAVTVMKAMCWF